MKTKLTLFFVLPLLVLISACKKNDSVVIPNQTITTNIRSSDWVSSTDQKTWSANIQMPEITSGVFDTDGVLVYVSYSNGLYEAIPSVYNGLSYSYTYSPGNIDIDVQDALADITINRPPAVNVKVVLIPSSF